LLVMLSQGVEDGPTWDQFAEQLEAIAMTYLLESD